MLQGLAAVVVVFWAWRIVGDGRVYNLAISDLYQYHHLVYEEVYRRIAAGTLPLWNPYQLCGIPWLPTLQAGFFYPPHVLYLLLPTHVAVALSGVLHLAFVAVTTAAFARRAGLVPAAALLSAVLFTLRGTIPFALNQPNILEAAAWLPLGSIAVLDVLAGRHARGSALLAVSTGASLLAGYPQNTVYLVYGWASLLVGLLLGNRAAPRRWLVAGAAFGAALALGAMLGGAQLVPSLELSQAGTRAARHLSVTAMFPMGYAVTPAVANLGVQALTGSQFSFGVVAVSLLSAAFIGRPHRALALWALVVGALTAAFSLGPLTPFFRLYLALPLLSWFRQPFRVLLLTDFCFAVLAGVALDSIWRARSLPAADAERSPRRSVGSRIAAALPVAAALGLVAYELRHGIPGALLLAAGTAVVAIGRVRARQLWTHGAAVALLALVLVELFLAPSHHLVFPYTRARLAVYHLHDDAYADLAARVGHQRVWVFSQGLADLAVKLATRHRIRAVDDYEPVNLARQKDYFTFFTEGTATAITPRTFDGTLLTLTAPRGWPPPATRRRLLDLAGVRFMMLPPARLAQPEVGAFVDAAGLERRPSVDPGLVLLENPHVVPRAFTVYRVRPAPAANELLERIAEDGFDPLAETYVEGDPGFTAAADAPARGDAATFTRDDEEVVEVEAALAAPGLVVLADTYCTGWRASVDGVPARIVPANHLFRGVPVPAGRHRVRFEYRPWTPMAGMILSLLGAASVAALLLWSRREGGGPIRAMSQ